MSNFYIPTIQEIRVGLEVYSTLFNDIDTPHILTPQDLQLFFTEYSFNDDSYIKHIVVKRLSYKDIISLNFKEASINTISQSTNSERFQYNDYELYFNINSQLVRIREIYQHGHWLFQGVIKNKTELKELLNKIKIQ